MLALIRSFHSVLCALPLTLSLSRFLVLPSPDWGVFWFPIWIGQETTKVQKRCIVFFAGTPCLFGFCSASVRASLVCILFSFFLETPNSHQQPTWKCKDGIHVKTSLRVSCYQLSSSCLLLSHHVFVCVCVHVSVSLFSLLLFSYSLGCRYHTILCFLLSFLHKIVDYMAFLTPSSCCYLSHYPEESQTQW